MVYDEEMRNFNKLVDEIREKLGDIENSTLDELVEMGADELRRRREVAKEMRRKTSTAKLIEPDRNRLISRIRKIEQMLNDAIGLLERIDIYAGIEVEKGPIEVGKPFKVSLILKNRNPFDLSVEIEGNWSKELKSIEAYPRSIMLKGRSSKTITFLLRGSAEGTFAVGPFTIKCRSDKMESTVTVNPVNVEILALKPSITIRKEVSRNKVKEGEEVEVVLTLTNEGDGIARDVYLRDDVDGLKVEGVTEWRGDLRPRSSQRISYKIKADTSTILKPATVTFLDSYGNSHSVQSNTVNLEVEREEKVHEKEEKAQPKVMEEKPETVSIELNDVLNAVEKAGITALIGYALGSISPKVKRVSKKVYVEGLRWTTWKLDGEDCTVIIEHPVAVVREEDEHLIRLRRATPVEILHAVDALTAKRLQEEFIHLMRGRLEREWRPEGEDISVHTEEHAETYLHERIREILRKRKEAVDEKKFERLPENPELICTYYRKGFLRKETVMKVYIKTFANVEKLYFDVIDHAPMSMMDAGVREFIARILKSEHPFIALLCSPTGWNEQTKRLARESAYPIIFVDLKTMETYFNEKIPGLSEFLKLIPRVEVSELLPEVKEIEKLDDLLLSGMITLDDYKRRISKLLSRIIEKEAET
jgi:hypothetical protein